LLRLVDSPIVAEEGDSSDTTCTARWVPGAKPGEGSIYVKHPPGVDCSSFFPKDRGHRIAMVRLGAYRKDLDDALDELDSTDGLAGMAKALYAMCESSLGFEDPGACWKKQQEMLNTPVTVSVNGACPPIVDDKSDHPVLVVNSSCSTEFLADADSDAREQAVQKGIDDYQAAKPATLTDLVTTLYRECIQRQQNAESPTDVLPCWERAREVGAKTEYEFVQGGSGCRASLDRTGSHIVLTGDRAACEQAFPKSEDARTAAVTDGGKTYEQVAALSGAKDIPSALKALYAFCDSGKGGDPVTCRLQGQAALREIEVQYDDEAGCGARVITIDGKPALEVGTSASCDSHFPTTGWGAAVDEATAAEESTALTGATDLGSSKAALYAFCDSGRGGDPVTCKKNADALLRDVPILRTGTSCTPQITTVDGKRAILVGPNCTAQFPDDPALRAGVVDQQATDQAQLAAAVRGTKDLAAAAKALYAYCDSGAGGDPAACKKAADALLKDTPIVRTGSQCTADVSTDNGKPVIVVGQNCDPAAFPGDPTARTSVVQGVATQNVPPNPAEPPASDPAVAPASPTSEPAPAAPTSTLPAAVTPPVENKEPVPAPPPEPKVAPPPAEKKVEAPPAEKVDPPPVKKKVEPPPVKKKVEPPPVEKVEPKEAPEPAQPNNSDQKGQTGDS
jgi:hypothetical protein